ncbi:MAG: Na(+)/H(+) antiporter subunit D [Candidatus Rokuibacteriota bacterium]
MSEWAHPAWPYLAGAALVGVLPRRAARVVLVVAPVAAIVVAWTLPVDARVEWRLMGQPLVWMNVDRLARVFAVIFALIGGLGAAYAWSAGSRRLHVAAFVAAAAAIGVSLAGDWVTLYLWWETLAVASFVLVSDGRTPAATAAAFRYLLVHAAGGALLLAGIAWHVGTGGSLVVSALALGGPGVLVLLGFAVNAAIPPLHAWLTDAYPESSPGAGVFLSAFATKSAVYALARVFAGEDLLVWAGVTMALYGVVFAVLENDIRRLLGYHIVSQVGYMVAGVGIGTPLALSGAAAHAFCHILYKGLLFMGAGAVVAATGRRKLTELGGLAPAMPATFVLYMIGAFSISGAPLLNGFVSKTLVVAAAEMEHRDAVAMLLTVAAVGTFLSVGLKLPFSTFFGPARGLRPAPLPASMVVAMSVSAALCALLGTYPRLLYALLPYPVDYDPYSTAHVVEALQLLAGTGVGFALLVRHLGGQPTVTLDADRLYRSLAAWVAGRLSPAVARAADALESVVAAAADARLARARPAMGAALAYAVLVAVASVGVLLVIAREAIRP